MSDANTSSPNAATAASTQSRGGNWVLLTAIIVVVIPILYVLSIGPAVRYAAGRPHDDHVVLTRVYAPVIWLHEHTFLERPLDWYVELWI